jgi:hypothetical protein
LQPQIIKVKGPDELESAVEAMKQQRAEAVIVLDTAVPFGNRVSGREAVVPRTPSTPATTSIKSSTETMPASSQAGPRTSSRRTASARISPEFGWS